MNKAVSMVQILQGCTDNARLPAYFHPAQKAILYLKGLLHDKYSDGRVWRQANNSWTKYELRGGGPIDLGQASSLNFDG